MPSLPSVEKFSYKHSEFTIKNLIARKKDFGVTDFDVMILLYLLMLSRRRVFIKLTTAELAEALNLNYSRVAHSIKTLKQLNLCKRIHYQSEKGFIIHPEIINNGDDKKRAFKFMLWDKN
jgi:predicted transcriptional regulator